MLDSKVFPFILKTFFTEEITARAKIYATRGQVEIENPFYPDEIIAFVEEHDYRRDLKVSLYFKDNGNQWDAECTCGEGSETCLHIAASLCHLQNIYEGKTSSVKKEKIEVPKVVPTVKRSEPSAKRGNRIPKKLESNKTNTFRLLPLEYDDFERTILDYAPRRFSNLDWDESFLATFISEEELEIISVSKFNQSRNGRRKIRLKKEGDKLYVKCLSCMIEEEGLCIHQASLLDAAKYSINRFVSEHSDFYKSLIAQASQKTKVPLNAIHKYYKIVISDEGTTVIPKSNNIISTDWIQDSQEVIDSESKERAMAIRCQTKRLENARQKKFAFFWGMEYRYSEAKFHLHFVYGDGLKTKEGIQASSREVYSLPTKFPKDLRAIGEQLYFAVREEELSTRFYAVKELIETHREQLNGFYQYAYEGDVGRKNVRASEMNLVTFHPNQLECRFTVEKKDGFVHITRLATVDGQPFDFSKLKQSNSFFCTTFDTAYCYPNEHFARFMSLFDDHETLLIPFTNKKEYSRLIKGFQQHFDVRVDSDIMMEEEILQNPKYQILLREVGTFVLFEPRLKYDNYSFNAFDTESFQIEEKVVKPAAEDQHFLVEFLQNAHPEFNKEIQVQDYVFLDVNKLLSNYWFILFNEACEATGIEVLGQKDLSKFNYSKHRAKTFSHVKSGIDWFDVDHGVSFGDEQVKTADWIKALRNKETFVRLKDGSLGVLPEEWLKQAQKILAVADLEKGNLRISKYRFNIIEDLFEDIDDENIVKELAEKRRRLADLELNKSYEIPKEVNAELREYQKHGYSWLKFLDESGFGGILADDMGLGKTLQVITLLADQIKAEPSIVIVPRSLLFNWAAEIDKFCPALKYIIHHGPSRARLLKDILPINVIITTYDTAASDIEVFKDFEFNYIILDESQAIKNPNSKRYKAMRLLKSNNKLAMTGTPIENNTFDLYAQLSFTSPGLLGTKTSFKNNFAIPIDNNGDTEAADLLRKLIHPFLLRRTKDQVAKDLPAKTESVIYCEMGATQRKLYTKLKQKIKQDIEEAVEEKGVNKSKFQMLDGLLRLRQMCNSPLLVNNTFTGKNAESVKIDILLEHLLENTEKHNALVFSQFVSLLTIVRKELDKRGIPYAYLDGSTTKRQREVDKFMNNEEIKIFLISIKAGNTGMNLTKADYVYILDPWWNPAVEAQAIDRTHRIGQDKQIFAYKLICKDSIEEKILKLQERKKKLATDIIRTDENVLKSLDKVELMSLFD